MLCSVDGDQEFELVRGLLRRERRERWKWGLSATCGPSVSERRRDIRRMKIIHGLSRGATVEFDPRWLQLIPECDQCPEATVADLVRRGAPETCHVMAQSEIDGLDLPLASAIQGLYDGCAGGTTLVICVPSKLAYLDFDEGDERYILERPASS
jgi:hypothetical protein